MKRIVAKTFYSDRKIYVKGQEVETSKLNPAVDLDEYFEPKPKAKRKVRKSKPKSEKVETKEEQKDNQAPAETDKDVESVEAPTKSDEEPVVTKED